MIRNSHHKVQRWLRVILAGPLTFLCAFFIMVGSTAYIPAGPAQLDNIVFPLMLFPALWAILFFYTSLTRRLGIAYLVVTILSAPHLGLIFYQLSVNAA
jgi:hypothetical protein